MKKQECLPWLLVIGLGLLVCALPVVAVVVRLFVPNDYSLSEVNTILGAPIPADATNIAILGHKGLSDGLPVTFDAPPTSAEQFAHQFCGGVLYKGYDPFNAVDTGDPFTYAHPITINLFHYFSYSLQTPDTLLGNRCTPLDNGNQVQQFVVDTSSPDIYHVKMEVLFTCNLCKALPSNSIQPVSGISLWLIGVNESSADFALTNRELCVGSMPDATDSFAIWGEMINSRSTPVDYIATQAYVVWQPLTPAYIEVDVDAAKVASAQVNTVDQLVERRDRSGNSVDMNASGNDRFYCFDPQMSPGSHRLRIDLTAADGTMKTYTWTLER